uniref:Uncharacterized protein n=1 Tax=Mus musculus TaxID=10090 RepID=Q6R5G4_MOUSE|nr:unknown [Mus musculus]
MLQCLPGGRFCSAWRGTSWQRKQVQAQAAIRSCRMTTAKCTSPFEKQGNVLCDPRIPGPGKTEMLLRPRGSLGSSKTKLQPTGLPSSHSLKECERVTTLQPREMGSCSSLVLENHSLHLA